MLYEFIRDESGKHQIGGDFPSELRIPENKFPAGFQYLGFIDNEDPLFSWLPFKVNLIHPIYADEYYVYLDYANPKAPTIIEPQNTASTSAFDELDTNSKIVFEPVKVKLEPKSTIDKYNCKGIAGTPDWLQQAEIPLCPKTSKPMRFLCQLMSFNDIKVQSSNVMSGKEKNEYLETLNFWCDGNLYIFIEPISGTMCYTMQNT